jgi:hypothetical protein
MAIYRFLLFSSGETLRNYTAQTHPKHLYSSMWVCSVTDFRMGHSRENQVDAESIVPRLSPTTGANLGHPALHFAN